MTSLETAVDAMSTGTGFNYNYDNINEYLPANKTYPNVLITFPEDVDRGSENNMIDSYSIDTIIDFNVTIDNTVANIDLYLDNVNEDFQRLMEQEHDDLQIQGMLLAERVGSERAYTNRRARPARINLKYKIFWRIKRSNPSSTT